MLHVGAETIAPVDAVRDLRVILDGEMTMVKHIAKITGVCYYNLRRLKQDRRILGPEIVARLVSAYVISRLDYCNSVQAGLPNALIMPLQRVQNAAAKLIKLLGQRDHISSTIRDLHWLPVKYRITSCV